MNAYMRATELARVKIALDAASSRRYKAQRDCQEEQLATALLEVARLEREERSLRYDFESAMDVEIAAEVAA
jgi:hypothetical protein